MSATIPAYCHATDAYTTAGLTPGPFSGSQFRHPATPPHIAYIRISASPEKPRHSQSDDEPLRSVVKSFTPAVDADGPHGFYLNFFGSPYLATDFEGTLRRLQLEILKQTGLNASIGLASSRVGAAVGSRFAQPGSIRILASGCEALFFASLPVEALHGIGAIDAADLRRRGISLIGELRRVPLPALQCAYGDQIARQIWHHARALDTPPVPSVRWSVATVLNFLASLLQGKSPCIANLI